MKKSSVKKGKKEEKKINAILSKTYEERQKFLI
jgi:hypothetical protein